MIEKEILLVMYHKESFKSFYHYIISASRIVAMDFANSF